ncbi:hypothetical protein DY000_02004568 [Brassica cretica]|uniref:Uncharacterized protein n=1 Tax=Brassica cretica TaxID=69181 RepID=A0ABQ7C3V5_BRACR|nr:hypothetical protein DY000_02004568 [Brassica cretica]
MVLKIVEPDHQENLELDDRTLARTSWNASWNGRVLRRDLERDASDREREQAASYRVASWLIGERELADRGTRAG